MAIVNGVYEEHEDRYSTWSHVFQGANTTWLAFDTTQRMGNFFNGLQGQTENAWNTQIPVGSLILSATMEFRANTNSAAAYTTQMNSPNRNLVDQQTLDPARKPFENFLGWRRSLWSNQSIAVLSTTFTAIAGPATAPANTARTMAQVSAPAAAIPMSDRFGQRVTVRPGPNQEVSFCGYECFRTGNPAGNLRCRIQGVTIDRGVTIPDGVDIAVSADVAANTLVVGSPGGLIGFFFAPGTVLVVGAQYFFILEHDYVQNGVDYISVREQNQFLTDGQLYHYGEGRGFDWQNYPGTVDLNQAIAGAAFDVLPGGRVLACQRNAAGVFRSFARY